MKMLSRFVQNESAATAIEYALIASLLSVAIVVAVTALGGNLNTIFTTVSTDLK